MTMVSMYGSTRSANLALQIGALVLSGPPRHRPPEEAAEEEEAQELPVSPDEGVPLIPDDERVIDMPS
jgi:hypothetical protein